MTETRILKRLNKAQIEKIRSVRMHFRRAQELTGVPWRAIATLWYRETFSVAPPTNRQGGQFQFDPPPSKSTLIGYLAKYILPGKLTGEEKAELLKRGIEHFPTAAIFAACHLRHKAHAVLTPDAKEDEIKDAFYGYNGRAYGSADKSPYVMNYADFDHYEMRVRGTVRDQNGNNMRVDNINKQIGALVVYRQLQKEIDG